MTFCVLNLPEKNPEIICNLLKPAAKACRKAFVRIS
jgi:hypothetical protein